MAMTVIEKVRESRPLIHHITNAVVMNFTANGLLAFGGSPIMANAIGEASDMTRLSNGLLLNIGTLNEDQIEAMTLAGRAANEQGIPVVFDPVGVSATSFRSDACERILKQVQPTAIKGNMGELAHLAGIKVETKGVDSVGSGDSVMIAKEIAEKYKTAAICTGEVDIMCCNGEVIKNDTGHPYLTQITGAGCLLGSLLTASLSVEGSTIEKGAAILDHYGRAAETAASHPHVQGPGTFIPHFIDALSLNTQELGK